MLKYTIYDNAESSEWIVFIHGLGSSSNTWVKQVRELKKYYNLLLIDLHGHGKSKDISLRNNTNPNFEEINNDIIKVLDLLNIESAHFIGISLGTIIVNSLTLTHTDRVKSIILGGAVTRIDFIIMIILKIIIMFKLTDKKWGHYIAFKITFPKETDKEKMRRYSKLLKKSNALNLNYWASIFNLINRTFKNKDYTEIPTLFIMGEEDKILIRNIVKNIRGASMFIIQNSTHLCHLNSPRIFNSVSIAFLKNYKNIKIREEINFMQRLDKE
ncbi:alpha/beta fold hydrolase [Anaeromicrobium sediminis]|uniref:AB hydrolase-1 domain-containing protein n=1 Tax=Anaeromicrobium sediminis TaxID=1478221 RepID=A0A267MNQ5_9FIRM|nr:alpha/beta hydrolase [Anaeromicrobium sediminis]PAB60380.1 hypothetical protein CCE28_05655 [Anaeromicrobium sediminis]